MTSPIIFNGKIYAGLEEMPPNERQAYQQLMAVLADQDQNGVPDILDGGILKGMSKLLADENKDGVPDLLANAQPGAVMHSATFVVDGQTYHSLDELPPDARQRYEAAMSKMGAQRDGMPDWLAGTSAVSKSNELPEWLSGLEKKPAASSPPQPTIIETDSSDGRLALAGCFIVVLFIGAAVMAYLLWLR